MSRHTDVKVKVKGMAEFAIEKENTDHIFIHNVGGVDLYIVVDSQANIYDLVFCGVNYEEFESEGKWHFMLSSNKEIGREFHENVEKLSERVAGLICQHDFRA